MKKPEKLDKSLYFTLRLSTRYKIRICKPLIPLKLTLFIYFGAGSSLVPFLIVLYKQRGISVTQISTMTMFAPALQYIGALFSGVVADKTGKSKPVVVVNMLITIVTILAITGLPSIQNGCQPLVKNRYELCGSEGYNNFQTNGDFKSDFKNSTTKMVHVPICDLAGCFRPFVITSKQNVDDKTFYFKNVICESHSTNSSLHSLNSTSSRSTFYSSVQRMCKSSRSVRCDVTFSSKPEFCFRSEGSPYRDVVFMAHFALFVIFYTGFTSSYNSLDVTMVFLAEKYDSSVGHEIAFGYLGSVLVSPFAAVLVNATSAPGTRNCIAVLYFYVALTLLTLVGLYKVPIYVKSPGEKMLSKGWKLIRNPHILVFFSLLLFLGTCYNLQSLFKVYLLDDMHASSLLIAIVTHINDLYGFPILLTSKYWLKKVGTQTVLILSLLCHGFNFFGYSLLQEPWMALLCEANAVVFHLSLWVAVIEFSNKLAPEGFAATLISTCGGVHWTMGKATSGFIGTVTLEHYGTRATFRFFAILCLAVAAVYSIYAYCTRGLRKDSQENHEKGKELNMFPPLDPKTKAGLLNSKHDSDREILLDDTDSENNSDVG